MSSTKSLSLCSHQAEFCCHAATQSHSIILRSIKRCGYPGRRESCLSFHSHCFFSPVSVFFVSQHSVPLTPLPPPSLTPNLFSLCLSFLHLFSLSPPALLSSPLLLQEVPAVMMKVLNIRGNPRRVSVAFSHLSFCARALVLWSTAQ